MDQAGTFRALYHWEAIDVLWIEFVLIMITTICWFAFRPWRRKKRKHIIKIQIASTFIIFAIWYFSDHPELLQAIQSLEEIQKTSEASQT